MTIIDIALLLYLPLLALIAVWLYGLPKNDEAANPWTENDGLEYDPTKNRRNA